MKKLYLIAALFFLFFTHLNFAQTLISGTMACNATLSLSASPYRVTSNLTILPGCGLTIGPGVEIQMDENTHIIVKGKIIFSGTAAQPIHIHAKDSIWGNILLDSTTVQKSIFDHVVIKNGRRNIDTTTMPAVIYSYYSTFEARDCRFENNLRCFYSYKSSNILIKNCVLDSTNRGEKILVQYANQVVIDSCTLFNTHGDADVIDFDGSSNVTISNNRMYGGGDDGIDLGRAIDPNIPDSTGCTNVTIEKNIIYAMFNKGISNGENAANININHNLIVNCGWGIGAKASAVVQADHNTIYKCRLGIKSYDHLDGWGPGNLTVKNSIIASCDSTWVKDPTALLSVSYSLSDSTLISGTGNIQGNPLFVSSSSYPLWDSLIHLYASPSAISSGDFHLSSGSPAIDSGDPSSPNDPDATRTDMGAFYSGLTSVKSNVTSDAIEIYPNPTKEIFYVRFRGNVLLGSAFPLQLKIYNTSGLIVHSESLIPRTFKDKYDIDLSKQASGVYYLQIISDHKTFMGKLVKH